MGSSKMKQGWFERNFGWIRDDTRHLVEALKKPETWITIGLVVGFGAIAWGIARVALLSDTMLRAVHPGMVICREQDNTSISVLFFTCLFFVLGALATVGEFFNYLEAKRHKAQFAAKKSLITMGIWGGLALALGFGTLLFLEARCA